MIAKQFLHQTLAAAVFSSGLGSAWAADMYPGGHVNHHYQDAGYDIAYEDTYSDDAYTEESYDEPAYEDSSDEQSYEEPAYANDGYEEQLYEEPAYEEPAYDDGFAEQQAVDQEWEAEVKAYCNELAGYEDPEYRQTYLQDCIASQMGQ